MGLGSSIYSYIVWFYWHVYWQTHKLDIMAIKTRRLLDNLCPLSYQYCGAPDAGAESKARAMTLHHVAPADDYLLLLEIFRSFDHKKNRHGEHP